jgi:hypothetical protein
LDALVTIFTSPLPMSTEHTLHTQGRHLIVT